MPRFIKATVVAALLSLPAMAYPNSESSSPDAFITSKAKISLWTKGGLRSSAVHVDTNDGVITLYGKVPTEEQRALAERTASEVSGVKSVNNLLQVVPKQTEQGIARSDKELKDAAEKELKADAALKDSHINVKSVDKGVVLLSGEARTYSDHVRAIALVDRLPGVQHVATEVKSPRDFREDERVTFLDRTGTKADERLDRAGKKADERAREVKGGASDLRISTEVKMKLLTAAQVPSTQISVDTNNGVVTLFGKVPSEDVKRTAGAEASKVAGVSNVENELEVVPNSMKEQVAASDADISREVKAALKDRPEFKKISPDVKNGTVRLKGTVYSGWDQLNALRTVWGVRGVRGVDSDLKVAGLEREPRDRAEPELNPQLAPEREPAPTAPRR